MALNVDSAFAETSTSKSGSALSSAPTKPAGDALAGAQHRSAAGGRGGGAVAADHPVAASDLFGSYGGRRMGVPATQNFQYVKIFKIPQDLTEAAPRKRTASSRSQMARRKSGAFR
jgi:hypothetical protein